MLVPTQQALTGEISGTRPDTAADKERLDQGKQALKKLLEKKRKAKAKKLTFCDYIRIYGSVLAGLLIIIGVGMLLFLLPMKIDPAWATLSYEFYSDPVVVYVQEFRVIFGLSNITWCSCSEACTREIYTCYQIIVSYKKLPEGKYIKPKEVSDSRGSKLKNSKLREKRSETSIANLQEIPLDILETFDWYDPDLGIPNEVDEATGTVFYKKWSNDCDVCNASLLVNIKACGYPPAVNCSLFKAMYGIPGRTFVGYYSRLDPYVVLAEYEPSKLRLDLLESVGGTVGFTVLGILLILLLQAPYAKLWRSMGYKSYRPEKE